MVFIITGASHTGKTALAQRLMEKYHIPYICQDHLKMGLIRSGNTSLTTEDDRQLTDYLWPITREMIKTVIENSQNLIIEGCYVPFDWESDFSAEYLKDIRYICLVLSEEYIDRHYDNIISYSCCIEKRIDEDYLNKELVIKDNRFYLDGCIQNGLDCLIIKEDYVLEIDKMINNMEKNLYENN